MAIFFSIIVVLLILLSFIFVLVNFIYFLFKGRIITNRKFFIGIELWTVVILPIIFLCFFDYPFENNCCNDSSVFSPEHHLGIYILLLVYTISYTISIFRQHILPPIAELLLNTFLILGILLNILLCIQLGLFFLAIGNIPIIMLLLIKLYHRQHLIKTYLQENKIEATGKISEFCLAILDLKPLLKFPLLVLLLIPILILLSLFLMIFGQKPDSIIKAFTDTYKHGFSQLDYMCDDFSCPDIHFLCTVGTHGHKAIVKPIRLGERRDRTIICNRQLLISNAFEELLQEKQPITHKFIRTNYNKVGDFVHRYYCFFNIKIVSDVVYILMKPLEWFFLLILYTFDKKPENRIAVQYLNKKDRAQIIEKGSTSI